MLTYKQALRKAASEILIANMHPEAWKELGDTMKDAGWALLVLFVRVLMILVFPLSLPLVALLLRRDENKQESQRAAALTGADREKLIKKEPI